MSASYKLRSYDEVRTARILYRKITRYDSMNSYLSSFKEEAQ